MKRTRSLPSFCVRRLGFWVPLLNWAAKAVADFDDAVGFASQFDKNFETAIWRASC
jgi:hypothetical protein